MLFRLAPVWWVMICKYQTSRKIQFPGGYWDKLRTDESHSKKRGRSLTFHVCHPGSFIGIFSNNGLWRSHPHDWVGSDLPQQKPQTQSLDKPWWFRSTSHHWTPGYTHACVARNFVPHHFPLPSLYSLRMVRSMPGVIQKPWQQETVEYKTRKQRWNLLGFHI